MKKQKKYFFTLLIGLAGLIIGALGLRDTISIAWLYGWEAAYTQPMLFDLPPEPITSLGFLIVGIVFIFISIPKLLKKNKK